MNLAISIHPDAESEQEDALIGNASGVNSFASSGEACVSVAVGGVRVIARDAAILRAIAARFAKAADMLIDSAEIEAHAENARRANDAAQTSILGGAS